MTLPFQSPITVGEFADVNVNRRPCEVVTCQTRARGGEE